MTALSQRYNLYFLACNDTVHVYQPKFPDQEIAAEPELILYPPTSPQTGSGIDYQDPHSVTRILVDYLGCEEVLLVACDDGDVAGYRIEEIRRVLTAQATNDSTGIDSPPPAPAKVFLHRNFGASAWGLAVHREARIIAISANTHQVTVLAYALTNTTEQSEFLSTSGNLEADPLEVLESEHVSDFPSPRQEDHIIVFSADTNIPAVSFNNNGDDPTGRWMFSCSIDGKVLLWDLHNRASRPRSFQMGQCVSATLATKAPKLGPGQCRCHDRMNVPHGAWAAMFLNVQSAYEISPSEAARTLQPAGLSPCFLDVTTHKFRFTVRGAGPGLSVDIVGTTSEATEDESDMAMSISGDDSDDSATTSDSSSMDNALGELPPQGVDTGGSSQDDLLQDGPGDTRPAYNRWGLTNFVLSPNGVPLSPTDGTPLIPVYLSNGGLWPFPTTSLWSPSEQEIASLIEPPVSNDCRHLICSNTCNDIQPKHLPPTPRTFAKMIRICNQCFRTALLTVRSIRAWTTRMEATKKTTHLQYLTAINQPTRLCQT